MTTLIQSIANQAEITFSMPISDDSFLSNLNELLENVKMLRASDLNFNIDTEQFDSNESAAKCATPVKANLLFKNDNFSIGMFVLANGSKIPLHDHPSMHSIIKVISGTVKYTSYSRVAETPNKNKIPQGTRSKIENQEQSLVPVKLHMSGNFTDVDDPCLSTPTEGNYHEIISVGGASALFDITAPPYTSNEDCHFYTLLESKTADVEHKFWLTKAPNFMEYWMKLWNYTGPKISL